MELTVDESASKTTLRISGPVRLGEVAALHEQAMALSALDSPVVLDLGAVEHLHAAAWQVLVALGKERARHGRQLHVVGAPEPTRTVMVELLNLQSWLSNSEDVD